MNGCMDRARWCAATAWALVAGCGPNVGTTGADPATTDTGTTDVSTEESADETVASADTTNATSDAPDLPPEDSVCGNGVVEAGEDCDEASAGCNACAFVCGIDQGFVIPAPYATLGVIHDPIAVTDGSGDILVSDAQSVHRATIDGELVWSVYGTVSTEWPRSLAVLDDVLWVGWIVGDGSSPWVTAFSSYDVSSGTETSWIEIEEAFETYTPVVRVGPDGSLVFAYAGFPTPDTYQPTIQGRSATGAEVIWTIQPTDAVTVFDVAFSDEGLLVGANESPGADDFRPLFIRYAADGLEQWRWHRDPAAEPTNGGAARDPSATADGAVVFYTEEHYDGAGMSVGNLGSFITHVVRLDADGALVWERDLSELAESGRIQLEGLRLLSDGRMLAVGSRLVNGVGDAWLGYLDDDSNLLCEFAVPDASGLESSIAGTFVDGDGALRVHGYGDEEAAGENSTAVRWNATLFPY
jgi:hypothetical protein